MAVFILHQENIHMSSGKKVRMLYAPSSSPFRNTHRAGYSIVLLSYPLLLVCGDQIRELATLVGLI